MLTSRLTVAEGFMMCTGALLPIKTGPTVTPSLLVIFKTLNRMFAESRLGQTRTLA